jgi:hypothetical protein
MDVRIDLRIRTHAMARKLTLEEELDRLDRMLEKCLRTPINSWKQEPRWPRFFELQTQREEELKESSNRKSPDKKSN